MEFPLKTDFFPPLRLTSDDRHRYVATAEYSVHVLRKLVADDKWKRISDAKGVSIGKVHCIEEQAYGGGGAGAASAAKACLIMCATVFTTGAVSEVLEAIASPVTDDYRRAMQFVYGDRFVDGQCLHTISPNGSRNNQAFTTIKWAAFKDGTPMPQFQRMQHSAGTDYCFLEHSGIQKEANRDESFGFCIQESIPRDSEVPVMTGLGLGRGELHRTGILIVPTDRKDVIQISSILQMDTATTLTKAALEKLMTRRVAAVAQIPLLLDRRRLSRMQFIPRENWVSDAERRVCAVCTKTFGLRRKHHCRHCGEVVCATCAPPRDVDVASYGIASIRICTACVVQSRTSSTQVKQDDVLVYHVRHTLTSEISHSTRSGEVDTFVGDDLDPPVRKASSADSNFSISSNDDDGPEDDEDDDEEDIHDDGHSTFDYDHHGYDAYDDYHDHSLVGSIAPGTPNTLDLHDRGTQRYSDYSDARSSDMSFSEFNTLADDSLRITSVPPRQGQAPPQTAITSPPAEVKRPTIQRTLYDADDHENLAPNYTQRRESMDEWFAGRGRKPNPASAKTPPKQKATPPVIRHQESMDDWSTPRPPSNAASHTSSGSSLMRESMDEWLGPRRRDRNLSQASTGSYMSGVDYAGGHDSKRSSSSASSSSSLMEMMTSIREIQNDLASVHQQRPYDPHDRTRKDSHRSQMHDQYYLERLSEQLREPELAGGSQYEPEPPTPVLFVEPPASSRVRAKLSRSARSSDASTTRYSSENTLRSGSGSDLIDMFNSDSFSILCPETLQRQQRRLSSGSQDAGERRSTRVSNLSASTVLEDGEDRDSMRQSELTALREQVAGLHKSLADATNKLNHYATRAAPKQRADSLEIELPVADDPVVADRKRQYHALIDELHEIMGLPALDRRG